MEPPNFCFNDSVKRIFITDGVVFEDSVFHGIYLGVIAQPGHDFVHVLKLFAPFVNFLVSMVCVVVRNRRQVL